MHASTPSLTVALVASVTFFASQAEALPMTRSSSSVARRAHIASHHHHHATRGTADTQSLGDHAILVDASSSGFQGQGGIKNSTINLTSISHQKKRDSTLSSFSRVVRSLFGGGQQRRRSSAQQDEPALPLTFSPSTVPTAAAVVSPRSLVAAAAANPKRSKRSTRNKNTHSSKQLRARSFGKHPRPAARPVVVNLKRRSSLPLAPEPKKDMKTTVVVPVAARYLTQQVKRGGVTYTEAIAQASAYSAAIAALPETTPTSSAVLADPSAAAPTVAAYIATEVIKAQSSDNEFGSPYSGSPLGAPNGAYGNAAAARARGFSSTLSWASVASSSSATPSSTPQVSVDANGITWVQAAAALATPEPLSGASSSTTVVNPKAAYVAVPTGSASSSSSSAPAVASATVQATSSALPTSPPPSTATASRR
ncbi:hypothetical protein JCM10908_006872 [Rhodotorula pacifica]|uniref:uncharacterized protein n=1 Tax=Rhodotorula pacifica TaxID=1495444 RepID=UPI00317B1228